MLRRKFYGTSSDEEDEGVKEEEKKELEWNLERIKKYYDADMHDHSKCKEAEKRRQRQSGFYYELVVFLISTFLSVYMISNFHKLFIFFHDRLVELYAPY